MPTNGGGPKLSLTEFEAIFTRWNRAVEYIVSAKLFSGDRDAIHDAAVAVWVEAYNASLKEKSPFVRGADEEHQKNWLFKCARCRATDQLRRKRIEQIEAPLIMYEDELFQPGQRMEDRLADRELLLNALQKLPARDIEILISRVSGEEFAQIAASLDISEEYARQIYCRARKNLRNILRHSYSGVAPSHVARSKRGEAKHDKP